MYRVTKTMLVLIAFTLWGLLFRPLLTPRDADAAAAHVPMLGMNVAAPPPSLPVDALTFIPLPGHPFSAVSSADGHWLFVSLPVSPDAGIAVLHQSDKGWAVAKVQHYPAGIVGMALTHDGKILIATSFDGTILFFDTGKLVSGASEPLLGTLSEDKNGGAIYTCITPDDRTAFVCNERRASITVINLDHLRRSGVLSNSVVGDIPVGLGPVGLACSPDGRTLYNTCERAPASWGWPLLARPEINPSEKSPSGLPTLPEGALLVIDVAKARTDPARAVVAKVPAGSAAVRVVLSPDGHTAYVTARGDNAVHVFDTTKLQTAPNDARIATITVGSSPVGVTTIIDGRALAVANSARFQDSTDASFLSVIDTAHISSGAGAILCTIPAQSFPRELCVTPNGQALLVTNYGSNTLEVVSLSAIKSLLGRQESVPVLARRRADH